MGHEGNALLRVLEADAEPLPEDAEGLDLLALAQQTDNLLLEDQRDGIEVWQGLLALLAQGGASGSRVEPVDLLVGHLARGRDAVALRRVTDKDLQTMGVPLGPRKKILAAKGSV